MKRLLAAIVLATLPSLALAQVGNGPYVYSAPGGGGGTPSGSAGGDLAGTYPNPTIAPNAVALGTDTTGSYAAGDAEAGAATSGDSATSFFGTGQIEAARGGTGADLSAATSGKYPKANGSGAFAASTLAAAGVGGCTNQVVTSNNADAAPTCASVADAYLTGLVQAAHGGTGGLTGLVVGNGASAPTAVSTSADLASVLSDETGSGGGFVRATSPTLTTPALGTPSALTLTNATGLLEAGLSLTDVTTANASASAHGFAPKWNSVRLFRSTNQSITNSTVTAISFDTERYDNGGMHEGVTNPTRITLPTAGVYSVVCGINYDVSAVGNRSTSLRLNGSAVIANVATAPNSVASSETGVNVSTQYAFAANDYVECVVFQTSGGSLNVVTHDDWSPVFVAARIQ